jgi:hypothetical protein
MQRIFLATSLVLASTTLTSLAFADLTVETKTSGGREGGAIIKQFYKGTKVRTESGGNVTIYDTATDRSLILDNAKKTYYMASVKRMQEMVKESPMGGIISKMKMTVTGDVKPGGQTKTILGKPAQNYKYTLVMNMDMSGMMDMIPEKERKGMPKGGMSAIKTTISGELWTTTAVSLANPSAFNKGFAAMQGGGLGGDGAEQIAAKMSVVKGFTLLSTQKIGLPEMPTGKGGKKPPSSAMSVRQEVVSLKESPLPDSLFVAPKGYKQVPMPAFNLGEMSKMGGMSGMSKMGGK